MRPTNSPHRFSKAVRIGLGRAIARAGEEKGIRGNVIAPGFIDAPMGRDAPAFRPRVTVPFGCQGTGWEAGYAALFLISNESSYVNAHTLFFDAGHMVESCVADPHFERTGAIALPGGSAHLFLTCDFTCNLR